MTPPGGPGGGVLSGLLRRAPEPRVPGACPPAVACRQRLGRTGRVGVDHALERQGDHRPWCRPCALASARRSQRDCPPLCRDRGDEGMRYLGVADGRVCGSPEFVALWRLIPVAVLRIAPRSAAFSDTMPPRPWSASRSTPHGRFAAGPPGARTGREGAQPAALPGRPVRRAPRGRSWPGGVHHVEPLGGRGPPPAVARAARDMRPSAARRLPLGHCGPAWLPSTIRPNCWPWSPERCACPGPHPHCPARLLPGILQPGSAFAAVCEVAFRRRLGLSPTSVAFSWWLPVRDRMFLHLMRSRR